MSNEEKLQAIIEKQEAEIQRLNEKIERLEHNLSVVNKLSFGAKSEKTEYLADGQLSMFNEAEKESDGKDPAKEKKTVVKEHTRKPKRTREELSENLPVKEVVVPLSEAERKCDVCGADMELVGKEYVHSELVYEPAKYYVRKIFVEVWKCTRCGTDESRDQNLPDIEKAAFKKAAAPGLLIPKSFCTPELLAHIIYEKYVTATPLYRQEKVLEAIGVHLSRTTMANWIIYAAKRWLSPVYEEMHRQLLTLPVIHADETVVQVLKEPGKKPQTDSRMWVYCGGNETKYVLFEYQPTRNGDHAKRFLGDYGGALVTDGYAGYNKLTNVTHACCWAHVRRKFAEALPEDGEAAKTSMAAKGLEFIDGLFSAERDIADMERIREIRKETSQKIIDDFYEWLGSFTANSAALQKAVGYAVSLKKRLTAFLDDPNIPLSNNRAENAIRPFVIGRKNWLFSDTVHGAESSAVIYSLIETAKANGQKPEAYLIDLMRN
jgi:hypothetical protein